MNDNRNLMDEEYGRDVCGCLLTMLVFAIVVAVVGIIVLFT